MTRRQQSATVDHLAQVAVELAVRVRDEDPRVNAVWLTHHLPDPRDWFRLVFVLAAGIPVDRPWRDLVTWIDEPARVRNTAALRPAPASPPPSPTPRGQQPCGTRAALLRHRRRGEDPCDPCRTADVQYKRERRALQKQAAA